MHICFLCSEYPKVDFPHGGFGTFVKTIAHQLVANGVNVSVVGINYGGNNEKSVENGVTIYRLKKNTIRGLSWYLNSKSINHCLKKIHSESPINIVESSELGLAFIKKNSAINYIIRLHGGHHFFAEAEKRGINFWKGFQEKRSFKKADGFIAVSHYVKVHTEKYLSYHRKMVAIIPNPINTELFKPSNLAKIVPRRIVFVGTVCEKKGVRELINAFQIVATSFEDATLYIYGRDWIYPNGDSYIGEMKKLVSSLKINRVTFMGAVLHDELPSIYESAEVCVFPSHMETQGLVAPEAMAMEKPVIFSNVGPGPETILEGETGFLVNPYEPQDIADKIMLCFNNEELTSRTGKNARIAAMNKFNQVTILKKNLTFYKDLVLEKYDVN